MNIPPRGNTPCPGWLPLLARRPIIVSVTTLLCLLAFGHAMPAEIAADNYRSSFEGYKPMTEDGTADWKATNAQLNPASDAGQTMQQAPHSMTHDAKHAPPVKVQAPECNMPGMEPMDHCNMHHGQAMQPMTDMPVMKGMMHDNAKGEGHEH